MDWLGWGFALLFVLPWIGLVYFAGWCISKVTTCKLRLEEQRNTTKMVMSNQIRSAVESVRMDQHDRVEHQQYEDFIERLWDIYGCMTPPGCRSVNALEKLIRRAFVRPYSLQYSEGQLLIDNSVVLPDSVVERLALKPGDFVYFINGPDGIRIVKGQ